MTPSDPLFQEAVDSGRTALDQADPRVVAALGAIADQVARLSPGEQQMGAVILNEATKHFRQLGTAGQDESIGIGRIMTRLQNLLLDLHTGRYRA